MERLRKKDYIKEFTCPICGKNFIPAPEHIYKYPKGGGFVKVCSYSCMRKHQKQKQKQNLRAYTSLKS